MLIALVDDEKNIRMPLSSALKKEGFSVKEYENGKLAFEDQEPFLPLESWL